MELTVNNHIVELPVDGSVKLYETRGIKSIVIEFAPDESFDKSKLIEGIIELFQKHSIKQP